MIIHIYLKGNLEKVAQPTITTIEEFLESPTLFYPDWNGKTMIYSENDVRFPKMENGELVEKTREELLQEGIVTLAENEIFVDGRIVEVDLKSFERIEDNRVFYDREGRIEEIKRELEKLKTDYSEREFIFKEKYRQKNRELDKNNLGNVVTMMVVGKQTHFKDWKFKDLEDNDVYVDLTMQDMMLIALTMQEQTTKSMKIETALNEKIKGLSDEELKTFNSTREYEKLWIE